MSLYKPVYICVCMCMCVYVCRCVFNMYFTFLQVRSSIKICEWIRILLSPCYFCHSCHISTRWSHCFNECIIFLCMDIIALIFQIFIKFLVFCDYICCHEYASIYIFAYTCKSIYGINSYTCNFRSEYMAAYLLVDTGELFFPIGCKSA